MSYEAWGDDDDGLDGVRESYRKTLLDDGWLDDEAAEALTAQLDVMTKAHNDLLDHLNGLLGLVQLVTSRNDLSQEIKDAMVQNHRFVDAWALSESYAKKMPT